MKQQGKIRHCRIYRSPKHVELSGCGDISETQPTSTRSKAESCSFEPYLWLEKPWSCTPQARKYRPGARPMIAYVYMIQVSTPPTHVQWQDFVFVDAGVKKSAGIASPWSLSLITSESWPRMVYNCVGIVWSHKLCQRRRSHLVWNARMVHLGESDGHSFDKGTSRERVCVQKATVMRVNSAFEESALCFSLSGL